MFLITASLLFLNLAKNEFDYLNYIPRRDSSSIDDWIFSKALRDTNNLAGFPLSFYERYEAR